MDITDGQLSGLARNNATASGTLNELAALNGIAIVDDNGQTSMYMQCYANECYVCWLCVYMLIQFRCDGQLALVIVGHC